MKLQSLCARCFPDQNMSKKYNRNKLKDIRLWLGKYNFFRVDKFWWQPIPKSIIVYYCMMLKIQATDWLTASTSSFYKSLYSPHKTTREVHIAFQY